MLLDQRLRGRNLVRSAVFAPFVISGAAVGVAFQFVFDPQLRAGARPARAHRRRVPGLLPEPALGAVHGDGDLHLEEPRLLVRHLPRRPPGPPDRPRRGGRDRRGIVVAEVHPGPAPAAAAHDVLPVDHRAAQLGAGLRHHQRDDAGRAASATARPPSSTRSTRRPSSTSGPATARPSRRSCSSSCSSSPSSRSASWIGTPREPRQGVDRRRLRRHGPRDPRHRGAAVLDPHHLLQGAPGHLRPAGAVVAGPGDQGELRRRHDADPVLELPAQLGDHHHRHGDREDRAGRAQRVCVVAAAVPRAQHRLPRRHRGPDGPQPDHRHLELRPGQPARLEEHLPGHHHPARRRRLRDLPHAQPVPRRCPARSSRRPGSTAPAR